MDSIVPASNITGAVSDHVLISLRRISQAIDLNSKSLVKRVGLTGPQLVILREIEGLADVSVGQLARKVSLSQATVTGILERLGKKKLIDRQRSPDDRRRVLVHITPEGCKLLAKAPPLMQESFVQKFNELPDWRQTMILSSLQQLVRIMEARNISAGPMLSAGSYEILREDKESGETVPPLA